MCFVQTHNLIMVKLSAFPIGILVRMSEGNLRNSLTPKGQLISKCPFVVFKSSKNPSKKILGFLPYPLKRGQIKKVV